jgi:hypothetical protein
MGKQASGGLLTRRSRLPGEIVFLAAIVVALGVVAYAFQNGREAEDRADAFFAQRLAGAEIDPGSIAYALENIKKSEPTDPCLSVPVRGIR